MARRASSFSFASRLLPDEVRGDVELLYAMFRALDDLVDDVAPNAAARVDAVDAWARRDDHRRTPEVDVLAEIASRRPVPRDAVRDFCEGMRDDLRGWRPATERELDRYCYRVAGTVGIVMAALLGADRWIQARQCAASLGMAMQRTNILRDIDEDLAAGRVYISQEALSRFGGSLAPGERTDAVRDGIRRADELYEDGLLGVGLLRRGRGAIALAAALYREILREIERTGLGEQPGRVTVPPPQRVRTVLRVVLAGR